jgi:uncharacterized protein with NRDE domain
MCVLTFSYKNHKNYELIVAANRDEFYARPTKPAAFWGDGSHIYGGRDLKEGGTWLAVSGAGKFAAITNYRDLSAINPNAPSRGKLVSGFLTNEFTAEEYSAKLLKEGKQYNGFNLVYTDFNKMYYYNNVTNEAKELPPGIYGLSNAFLDTDWPKLTNLKAKFEDALKDDEPDFSKLFAALDERAVYPDELLPDTKIGLDLERMLSSIFIVSPEYGTRSSTVLSISNTRVCRFAEKTFNKGSDAEMKEEEFEIQL